jgi:hypothetical protein
MQPSLPQPIDLQNLWASTKVIDPTSPTYAGIDWARAITSATRSFQTKIGRRLIALWQTRYFDPPQGENAVLRFKADLASCQGVVATPSSTSINSVAPVGNMQYLNGKILTVTLQGTGIVTNGDFYWGPNNAQYEGVEGEGRPWTWLDFQNFFPSPLQVYLRQSIAISGYWGYIAPDANNNPQIPDDIWHAILHLAAIETIPEIELSISRGRSGVQTQIAKYAFNKLGPQFDIWSSDAKSVIDDHRKVETW